MEAKDNENKIEKMQNSINEETLDMKTNKEEAR